MKAKVLCLIVLILFSACITLPGGEEKKQVSFLNDGVIIKNFASDLTEIREDDGDFVLTMEVQNVGERTARNVKIDLYGINWLVQGKGYAIQDFHKEIPSLLPPDIQLKEHGEFQTLEWDICVPDLPEGARKTLDIIGRVTFDYSTTATVSVHALTREEYTRRKKLGQEILTTIDVSNSFGPLRVSVDGEAPVIVETRRAQYCDTQPQECYELVSYRITFSNVGSGVPITHGIDGKVIGTLKVGGPGVQLYDCFDVVRPDNIMQQQPTQANIDIRLRYGGSVTKACTVKINRKYWKDNNIPEDIITFVFDLNYTYYVQKTLTLTFYGQEFAPPYPATCLRPRTAIPGAASPSPTIPTTASTTQPPTPTTAPTTIAGENYAGFLLQSCSQACKSVYPKTIGVCRLSLPQGGGKCDQAGGKADQDCTNAAKGEGRASGKWLCCCFTQQEVNTLLTGLYNPGKTKPFGCINWQDTNDVLDACKGVTIYTGACIKSEVGIDAGPIPECASDYLVIPQSA